MQSEIVLSLTTFTLSVGCGCGTFEWLLRVSSYYKNANELKLPCRCSGNQNTSQEYPQFWPLRKKCNSGSNWSEGSRVWGESEMVGKSTFFTSFHQAWWVAFLVRGRIRDKTNLASCLIKIHSGIMNHVWPVASKYSIKITPQISITLKLSSSSIKCK